MAELSWAAEVRRNIKAELDLPVEDEELVLKRFVLPSEAEIETALGWLYVNWVKLNYGRAAMMEALESAVNADEHWLMVLHRVVNRLVRQRYEGWHLYGGNWLDMIKVVEAAKAIEDAKQVEACD